MQRRVLMMCAPWHSRPRYHHRKKQKLADVAATESESDVQSEKLPEEALTRFYPPQTAVAANGHQGGSVIKQLLSRNAASYSRREHSSGGGVPSASVAGRSPALLERTRRS